MREEPERFSEPDLRAGLGPYPLGKRVYYFHTIDSTNNYAKKLASAGAKEGTLVISEEQTRGRGRWGRKWISPAGTGIWMSLILRPEIRLSEAVKITIIAAVAAAVAIQKVTGLKALIKWPNDIILRGKKVGGILTELGSDSQNLIYVVVGIGINVNTEEFPEEIADRATSLMKCRGWKIERRELLVQTIAELGKLYFDLIENNNLGRGLHTYKKISATIGKRVRVITPERDFIADAIDITKEGELLVKKDDGEILAVNSGEVSLREEAKI